MKICQKNLSNKWIFDKNIIEKVEKARQNIKNDIPWFSNADYDEQILEVENNFKKIPKDSKKILIIWIWWSSLWAKAVLDALWKKDFFILDDLDPDFCENFFKNFDFTNVLINIISKSWNTIETLSYLYFIEDFLKSNNINIWEKVVITTWKHKNPLRDFWEKYWCLINTVPDSVWGRFSVFSSVWLFPLLFLWVDIKIFIKSFKDTFANFFKKDFAENAALKMSAFQYFSYKKEKKNISVFMTYSKKLQGLLFWNEQLIWESLWKWKDIWITPINAFGSSDQHSKLQLFLSGPDDKSITFLESSFWKWPYIWEQWNIFWKKHFWEIHKALLVWTKKSLEFYNIWYQEMFLEKVDELNLAKFLTIQMLFVSVLWDIFWINPYNQDSVEFWKIQAKKYLQND